MALFTLPATRISQRRVSPGPMANICLLLIQSYTCYFLTGVEVQRPEFCLNTRYTGEGMSP